MDEPCLFAVTSSIQENERSASIWKLWCGLILCIALKVVCGFKAHSLAILVDALHMFKDIFAYAISLFYSLYGLQDGQLHLVSLTGF